MPSWLLVDLYGFFYAAILSQGVVTLEDLHTIIREIWLTRHDAELEEERASRRKGRPKSVKEQKIEELKLRETEEYRTGMGEIIAYALLRDRLNAHMHNRGSGFDACSER